MFYLDPGPLPGISTAYWGPQVKFGVPQPALNVNMDTWTNVESLSFRYEPQDSALPIVFIQEPTTDAPIPIPIPPVTPLNPPLGVVVPPPPKIEQLEDTAKLSPGQALMHGHGAGVGERRRGHRHRLARRAALRAGAAGARSWSACAAPGRRSTGCTTSTASPTRIKRGEYKQSFTLKRNALISNTPVVPAIGF